MGTGGRGRGDQYAERIEQPPSPTTVAKASTFAKAMVDRMAVRGYGGQVAHSVKSSDFFIVFES
jgi:hypothetical protein